MAKKKKSTPDPKVLRVQYKNNYKRELKKYCDHIHPDLYPRLTKTDLEMLYLSRGTVVRTVGDESPLPGWMARHCDEFVRRHMHEVKIEVIPGVFEPSLMEYSLYIIPLEAWSRDMADRFDDCDWFKEIFVDRKKERINTYESYMNYLAVYLMYQLSHTACQYCNIRYTMGHDLSPGGTPRVVQQYKLKGGWPKEYIISYDKNDKKEYRKALDILYNYFHLKNPDNIPPFTPLKLSRAHFGMATGEEDNKPLPVFILRHAISRLEERLECLMPGYIAENIIASLEGAKLHPLPEKDKVLVEFYIDDAKAGYLVTEVGKEAILIRTFLFLTNAGTPEGENLRIHLGLHKQDIKFFNIDRLTPLMETDLLTDEKMCDKLRNAGCGALIDLYKAIKENGFFESSEEQKQLAATLRKYMMEGEEVEN